MESFSVQKGEVLYSFLLVCLPFALGFFHAKLKGRKSLDMIWLYYLFIGIGVQGMLTGLIQLFYSDFVTYYVRWNFSPFLLELGLANLSYGILGILSPWMNRGWQTATVVGYGLFLLFTGMKHLIEIAQHGANPGNAGAFLYTDLLIPCALFTLLALRHPLSDYKLCKKSEIEKSQILPPN